MSEPYLQRGQLNLSLAAVREAEDGYSMVLSSQMSTDATFNYWYGNRDRRLFILYLTSITYAI